MNRAQIHLIFVLIVQFSFGQNSISINGKVVDDGLYPFPGVELIINDKILAVTDFDGKFNIEIDKNTSQIVFRLAGTEPLTVTLKNDCNKIELIFPNDGGCYLGASLQKVNRIRKRNFEKRKKLYKTAYEKGIFSSESLCGEIQFEPYK